MAMSESICPHNRIISWFFHNLIILLPSFTYSSLSWVSVSYNQTKFQHRSLYWSKEFRPTLLEEHIIDAEVSLSLLGTTERQGIIGKFRKFWGHRYRDSWRDAHQTFSHKRTGLSTKLVGPRAKGKYEVPFMKIGYNFQIVTAEHQTKEGTFLSAECCVSLYKSHARYWEGVHFLWEESRQR